VARCVSLSIVLALTAALARAADVQVWLTRGDQASLLEQRTSLAFQPGSGTHATRITLDPATRYQSIDGFGAALTDSSAWVIQNRLSAAQRTALLQELFSPQTGIGISFLRIPMGASDFALSAYTYDDRPAGQTDPNLAYFSIAHDQAYILPLLQQARALNPALRLMATPWSPPAWMKTSQTLNGGALSTNWHAAYAQYFVRFLQDYAAAGTPVYALTVQNEPLKSTTAMPSASMSTFQQSSFIGGYLGPALAAAGLDTHILCYDHNWDQWNYPVVVLNDPVARPYLAGAAFHGYAGDVAAQSTVHDYHPDKDIYFTEISGGDWSTSFADDLVWGVHTIVIGTTRNWSKTALWWNLALDENHGPHLSGACTDCRGVVTINSGSGAVSREPEYYALAHASRFVPPGLQRIASDSLAGTLETVAFRSADGREVLLALNPGGSSLWFDVLRNGQYFAYRLTPKSVATFVWYADVPGDADGDGAVDFTDFAAFSGCLAGPEQAAGTACRAPFDSDGDTDIDLADYAVFQGRGTGPR
jgi:glucosylceramidase